MVHKTTLIVVFALAVIATTAQGADLTDVLLLPSPSNLHQFNLPITDWFDKTVFANIFKNIQSNNCTGCERSSGESGVEDCPCPDGELCVDVFTSSMAYEDSALWPSAKEDYCAEDGTLMEAYIKCDITSRSYYAQMQCPPGFVCNNGSCVGIKGTKIGPAGNVSIDDNGSIVSATYITINGTRLDEPRDVVLGENSSIESASSLIYNKTKLKDILNLSIYDNGTLALRSTMVELSGGTSLSIHDLRDVTFHSGEDWLAVNATGDNARISVQDPFDNATLRFNIKKGGNINLSFGGKTVTVVGDVYELTAGLPLPAPSFVKFQGSGLTITSHPGFATYSFDNGSIRFLSPGYEEDVYLMRHGGANVSYQTGIRCAALSGFGNYTYTDMNNETGSFRVHNKHLASYSVCVAKVGAPIQESSDALFDLPLEYANMTRMVVYQRMNSSGLVDVYDSRDNNTARLNSTALSISNDYAKLITSTYTSFFRIDEFENNRYLKVKPAEIPAYIERYTHSGSHDIISVMNHTLLQTGLWNNVTVAGPGNATGTIELWLQSKTFK
jgi:hypothetical protein